jgi:pyridoxal phosphate enzyme (YggS family)
MTAGQRWQTLTDTVAQLALQHGRNPSDITIIAVTKGRPISDILSLYQAGCRHFGESRIQEALQKQLLAPPDIQWHFIGTLQRNKINKAHFALIHSVDSLSLASAFPEPTPILLQVNTSNEPTKHGWSPEALLTDYSALCNLPHIQIQGLMTIASRTDPATCFSTLRQLRDTLSTPALPLPHLSMGMSSDYPLAIAHGATLLRIGSALFG